MKYIRTKNKIIENNNRCFIDETCEESYKSCNGIYYLSPKDIIKQVDTIEELCDKAIEICEDGRHIIWDFIDSCKEYHQENSQVYGAIWTDKGLIYFAKMNDKGELKLRRT